MTDTIIKIFRNAGFVNPANEQIILLGVRRICGALKDLLIAMLWSFTLGDIFVGILFEACYSLLRIYAGGYHASSEKLCKYLTYASTFICILIIFIIPLKGYPLHCLIVCLVVLIVFNTPVENENKPLNKKEKKIYHGYCMAILLVETVLYFLFVLLDMALYSKTVCIAILLVVIGVIIGKRKQYGE